MMAVRADGFWLLALVVWLGACDNFSERPGDGEPGASDDAGRMLLTFPHPENYANPDRHGVDAIKTQKELCGTCHGSDFGGSEVGVSCRGCHATYPHTNWQSLKDHGRAAADLDVAACQRCHANPLNDELASAGVKKVPRPCGDCHEYYPHASGWKTPGEMDFHGVALRSADKERCALCHGEKFDGNGDAALSCYSCHAAYPHAEGFAKPEQHGQVVRTTADWQAACGRCHVSERPTDPPAGETLGCRNCHDYPHVVGWLESGSQDFHGTKVMTGGKEACSGCHGADFSGNGDTQKSCRTCHDYPHVQGWLTPTDQGFHGTKVKTAGKDGCSGCHGADFSGNGNAQKSCRTCHDYPHAQGWLTPASQGFHGAKVKIAGKTACSGCHGADFSGNGEAGKSCLTCHDYPHATAGWLERASDNFHGAHAKASGNETCGGCHGANFSGNGDTAKNCRRCHDYPHDATWVPAGHMSRLNEDPAADAGCKVCHGADHGGGTSGVSCFSCHRSFPHPDDWMSPPVHGGYVIETTLPKSDCKRCHGADYNGGSTASGCKSCHDVYPHSAKFAGSAIGNPDHHIYYLMESGSSAYKLCGTRCHGSELDGGDSGVSCFSCHWQR